ncbi:MAG: hypothetical protein Q9227_000544 [Pyrenula ochraceoflavens]
MALTKEGPKASSAYRTWSGQNVAKSRYHFSTKPNVQWEDPHNEAVKRISTTVRHFFEKKEKFRVFHGSTNSTRQSAIRPDKIVDTSPLSRVLEIDPGTCTAIVEPNVPMDRLVEETLRYGLIPPVVMEFPGITVGGGYSGTCGESSSFKHGFFDQTINRVEMVLANGDVTICSREENADLFHGAAGAVGTIGITTLVELQLRKATKYVETTYHPVPTAVEAVEKIKQKMQDPDVDYIDGVLYSMSKGAIVTGRLTDTPKENIRIQRFSNANDPWFYLHVKDAIEKRTGPTTEAIPLAEYLFRYDRGGFWVGKSAFEYFNMPFNSFTRWWLDDFLHTRMMYTALHASGQSKRYVVQDLALPFSTAEKFLEYTDKTFSIYPLWLCPLKQSPMPTMHPHHPDTDIDGAPKPMLNIGLWGYGPAKHKDFVTLNRDLEHKLKELGGMKWLYAHTYYTEDEFWKLYDKNWYDALRTKYGADTMPNVFEKVRVDVEAKKKAVDPSMLDSWLTTWPLGGLYGIKKAIDSGSYLQARSSQWKASG